MSALESEYTGKILDRLNTVSTATGYGLGTVFVDWVDLVMAALKRDDDAYLEILNKHGERLGSTTDKETIATAHSEAFALTLEAVESTGEPVLGAVYQRIGASSDHLGQHFTPPSVVRLMAAMSGGPGNNTDHDEPETLHDPTCGDGRMMLIDGIRYKEAGVPVEIVAVDKDPTCARMTAIHLFAGGLPATVFHADSLTTETYAGWRIDGNPLQPVTPLDEPDYGDLIDSNTPAESKQ